jgi:N-acetylglucosaminyldiphosphoundecaprenol N-acetyl-beta-D-mannosaminyltransferase
MQQIEILGVKITRASFAEVMSELRAKLQQKSSKRPIIVVTPNPEQVVMAQTDKDFAAALSQADLALPDGIGLIWAAKKLVGDSLPERVAGVEVVQALLDELVDQPIVIVGGRGYQIQQQNIHWLAGDLDLRQATEKDWQKVRQKIVKIQPVAVFVAFGAPDQEMWLADVKNQQALVKAGTKIAMAVGGSFDFIFGKVKRAPKFIQNLGMEWLFRLILQPWRLKRQLRLIQFVKLVLKNS